MKIIFKHIIIIFSLLLSLQLSAQVVITGKVTAKGKAVAGADVFLQHTGYVTSTDHNGVFVLQDIPYGTYKIAVFSMGKASGDRKINLLKGDSVHITNFELVELAMELSNVTIQGQKENTQGITRLNTVKGFGIYEAKKNEVVVLDDIIANKASNNARQIFAKVPGLNIWESDCAGLQIGVGGRGLSPDRNSNFNTRQNGYDISADALGYPESYYSPALQAVERIEIVRGAASLQYGTQFGGLVNFVLKNGPEDKKFEFNTAQTANSLGFYSSFNSFGGTIGKVNYYAYNRYAKGDCWRCNSDFESNTSYASARIAVNSKLRLSVEYTNMYYLSQQPGGLTDALFQADPRQSIRNRNWFRVNWNLMAVVVDYRFSDDLKMNIRNFGLIGGRDALGNLGRIDRADDMQARNLFVDDFRNFGSEVRFIYNYTSFKEPAVLLVGGRYYNGLTDRRQGNGPAGDDVDFTFTNPDNLEGSDYKFPGQNISAFAENVFNLSDKFSLTPGVRFEYIQTEAEGYYQNSTLVVDPLTGFAMDSVFKVPETRKKGRSFLLFGLGASYKYSNDLELYANVTQNYRSINFNDIRVENPNLVVDKDITDEKGYNADIGLRGGKEGDFNFDISLFYLRYHGRIGSILKVDDQTYRMFRYRTNISDSRNIGIEAFGEVNLNQWFHWRKLKRVNLFLNIALIDARYTGSEENSISNNYVELVPPVNIKSGINCTTGKLKFAYQFSYIAGHFTDASNAETTPSAVEGEIPSYHVMDFSGAYQFNDYFSLEAGVNNLTDNHYFTRRASGYPGPGIIPADGRSFYLTLQMQL